ncbi:hypothetical protein Lesp02_40240 [Lentzea sp. NBRC 105346]|uniref:Gfo/Idh/MocA family protein n=1 Tax=Lentzea sp. NBRC 105346 TaxID=3032205 RepID=UPI0024A0289A|nr:Gfo/Idh/MocA family oxidoreductase [Lentzea sp. NBRC 105346]GLZ31836.1 hypothetical protein Lesp02_40240 [Lentzea sp. NBRC 105346]
MIRVGVVGLGVISRFYLRAIASSPSFELAAVCDLDPDLLAPHEVPAFTDHRDLLGVVDAVIVTAPNDVHAAVCRDAIAAGLPVCVEKPLATTLADGVELVEAARKRDVALFTAFHRRYNRNVLALPVTAPVRHVTVRYLERIEEHVGRDRWYLDATRCGGGCVADNGPNALDVARLFVGPLSLVDATVTRDELGVDRRALLRLDKATIELDWSFPGEVKDVTVELVDGIMLHADMLAGFAEFKGSLWHEYAGILREFATAVERRGAWHDGGLDAPSLVDQVYRMEAAHARERAETHGHRHGGQGAGAPPR